MSLPFPEIDPVAFSLGPFIVRWYALAYLAGILGGWQYALWLNRRDPSKPPSEEKLDNFLPWVILAIILGGRLGYVLFYQPMTYLHAPLDAFKIWEGGMSFHGGALGVIISLIIYAWIQKIPLLRLTDIVCAVVPIGLFFGRIANFINGELWGRTTAQPWGVVFPHAGPLPRHPSQLYEAFLEGLVLFFILMALYLWPKTRNMPGIVTGAFLAGYGIFRAFVELFRQPDAHLGFIIGSFSMGQLLSLPMILLGLGVIAWAFWQVRRGTPA
jgi:phosphatidylglycerol:prolipoprotein diacylglycerol transferase